MVAGRWRGMLGRLDVRDALDQRYSEAFSNPVSKSCSLTYHSKFINEDSASGAEENLLQ